MSVSTLTTQVQYTATGSSPLPVTFSFFVAADLKVTGAAGTDLPFTVGGVPSEGTGTVTLVTPVTSQLITIKRVTALTQPAHFGIQGIFSPKAHEAGFDRATMQIQDQKRDTLDAVTVETAARAAADAAIIASGVTPANVGIAPVIATGTALTATVSEWMSKFSGKVYNVLAAPFLAKCDGTTDDTEAIQAAVDAAVGGGLVYFPVKGRIGAGFYYKTTSSITVAGADITLMSDAPDINGNSAVVKNVTSGPIFVVTGERFSMRHLDLQGDDLNVDGITITSTAGNIDGTIRNCTFGYLKQAVTLTGRNFHVTDNIFGQCLGGVAIVEHGSGDSRDFFIDRNQMEGMGLQTAGGLAATFAIGAGVFNVQIMGNFAYQGRYAKFVTIGNGAKRITIQGNVLDQLNNSAVEMDSAEDVVIQGNVFRWATPWSTYSPYAPACYGIVGTLIARGAIQNNLLVNCPQHGIYFNGACTDLSIQGNTIIAPGVKTANTYDGIWLEHGSCAVTIITGNLVDAGATAMRYGIRWAGSAAAENHVYGNIVYSAATANYLGDSAPMTLGGNLILRGSSLSVAGVSILTGSADPSGGAGVAAALGSLYLRTTGGAGTTLFVKESASNTGWAAK